MISETELFHKYSEIKKLLNLKFGLILPEKLEKSNKRKLLDLMGKAPCSIKASSNNAEIKNSPLDEHLLALINIFTVSHTSFFRIKKQFEFFKEKALPNLLNGSVKDKDPKLRFWSAATASGEEAYSILLTFHDYLHETKLNHDSSVLATDINIQALNKGHAGEYRSDRVDEKLSSQHKIYLSKQNDEKLQFSCDFRHKIEFRWLNLNSEEYPLEKFHVIFCRNVLFYLTEESRKKSINKLIKNLHPGGYLFLGLSETRMIESAGISCVGPAIYRKDL